MLERLWPALALVADFLIRLGMIALLLLREHKRPSSRAAWVMVILALPLLGIPLYVLIGEVRLGRRRIARHKEIVRRIDAEMAEIAASPSRATVTFAPSPSGLPRGPRRRTPTQLRPGARGVSLRRSVARASRFT